MTEEIRELLSNFESDLHYNLEKKFIVLKEKIYEFKSDLSKEEIEKFNFLNYYIDDYILELKVSLIDSVITYLNKTPKSGCF